MTVGTLPQWDLDILFPGLDDPAFIDYRADLERRIGDLEAFCEKHGIGNTKESAIDPSVKAAAEQVINRLNDVQDRFERLDSFVYGKVSTNSRDDRALARQSEFDPLSVRLSLLDVRTTAWFGSLDIEKLISTSQLAKDHTFALRRAKVDAQHQMSPAEEAIAAEMHTSGGGGWEKLHGNVTSQLTVKLVRDGETVELPMSAVRALASDPSGDVRKAAYDAELKVWVANTLPIAAALNGIKGETNFLTKRRGWDTPLDRALHQNHIDQTTLDAMLGAARDSFPQFRRYLKAKATYLGMESLPWWDMFGPIGKSQRTWNYEEGTAFIVEQFGEYSPRMSEFAARAFRENWVDAGPRPGKVDGAYCMHVGDGNSRILANYTPSYSSVTTMAHELGHGYHNLCETGRTAIQRRTPMTLAETASIFCETIIRNAALAQSPEQERLLIYDGYLEGATQVVVDITSRFLFESRMLEARREREQSAEELSALMLAAQAETYGDGLDAATYHPYMWAVKSHYYSVDYSFYNFPYMFGLLFGLGLYARYLEDKEQFKQGYDELLSLTGTAEAAELGAKFGIDTRSRAFWEGSLRVVASDIEEFERLAVRLAPR